jgi:MFS family permease
MSVAPTQREPNRWAVLSLLSVAQLMVVLDATIVTIAIPSAQNALHFSIDSRQWIVTAYALAFGSLLLLGGKLGDLFGYKWTLIAGLLGFSIASAIGGLAQSFGVLVAARTLQGVFGALLAPSALGLLTVTFAQSPDRNTAFGIFGAIAGGAASLGLILGGALTEVLSWRWCLYVNLVIAVPTTIVALRLLVNHTAPERDPIDIPGVLTSALGLFALVYGFSNAETHSWGAAATVVALVASPVLLTAFVLVERRAKHPLLPLHIIVHHARAGRRGNLRGISLSHLLPAAAARTVAAHDRTGVPSTDRRSGGRLDHRPDPRDPTHRGKAAGTRRHGARGALDVPVHAADARLQLCRRCPPRPDRPRRRNGLHLRPGVLHGDSRRAGTRGRRRLSDG